jgi:hypothetical protein
MYTGIGIVFTVHDWIMSCSSSCKSLIELLGGAHIESCCASGPDLLGWGALEESRVLSLEGRLKISNWTNSLLCTVGSSVIHRQGFLGGPMCAQERYIEPM